MRFCSSQKIESVRSQSSLASCSFRSLEHIEIIGIFGYYIFDSFVKSPFTRS
jgi:hypothetical protein